MPGIKKTFMKITVNKILQISLLIIAFTFFNKSTDKVAIIVSYVLLAGYIVTVFAYISNKERESEKFGLQSIFGLLVQIAGVLFLYYLTHQLLVNKLDFFKIAI